jgi:hypothetical protein
VINQKQFANIDETCMPLNNRSPGVVPIMGSHELNCLTSAERGKHVTVVPSCNATGARITPFKIFKDVRMNPDFKVCVPAGYSVAMSETG